MLGRPATGLPRPTRWAISHSARWEVGALEEAGRAVPVALEAAEEPDVAEHFVAGIPHLAAAALHSASGRVEVAARHAERALTLARRGAGRLEVAAALAAWAQAGAAVGCDTQRELEHARVMARACPDPGEVVQRLSRIRLPRAVLDHDDATLRTPS